MDPLPKKSPHIVKKNFGIFFQKHDPLLYDKEWYIKKNFGRKN